MNGGQAVALAIAVGILAFMVGQTYEREVRGLEERQLGLLREIDTLRARVLELQKPAAPQVGDTGATGGAT